MTLDNDDITRLAELEEAAYLHLTPQHGVDGAHVAALRSVVSQLKLNDIGVRFTDTDSVDVVLPNGDEMKGYRTNIDRYWHFVYTKHTMFDQSLLDDLHEAIEQEEARIRG